MKYGKILVGLALLLTLAGAGCKKKQILQEKTNPIGASPSYQLESCVQNETEIAWTFRKTWQEGSYDRDALVKYVDEDKDMDLDRVHGITGYGGGYNHYSEESYPNMQIGIPGVPEEHEEFFKENCINRY